MDKNTKSIIRRILSDIRVELGDEFDRNFERQAFLMMPGHEGKARHVRAARYLWIQAHSGVVYGAVQQMTA